MTTADAMPHTGIVLHPSSAQPAESNPMVDGLLAEWGFTICKCLQVAGRTNDAAGDGTTTASVLARDLIHYGLQVSCTLYLLCEAVKTNLFCLL